MQSSLTRLAAVFLLGAGNLLAQSTAAPLAAWVEMVPGGAQFRVIMPEGSTCPVAELNGKPLTLVRREEQPGAHGFPMLCQAPVPPHAHHLKLQGTEYQLAKRDVKRIILIGDTGCRVNAAEHQNCERDWPFGKIADLAAARKPDLVLHVGDYYYREACSAGARHCENWTNWNADFFAPARKLLAAAPWGFARGNHETCNRAGGEGWFRYLDAANKQLACPAAKATPFLIPLKGVTLAVLDTADMPDIWPADKKLDTFAGDLAQLVPPPGTPVWIVTHKPPFVDGYMNGAPVHKDEHDPAIPGLEMILAGHLHLFGSMDFQGSRPAQLIVGDSGTRLMVSASNVHTDTLNEGTKKIDDRNADFTFKGQFGYFLLERKSSRSTEWHGTLFGMDDHRIATCDITGKRVHCVPVDAKN